MDTNLNPLESIWDGLLSRQPELVRATFTTLDTEARAAVLAHLQRMVSEDGWHPEQRLSAQDALHALDGFNVDG